MKIKLWPQLITRVFLFICSLGLFFGLAFIKATENDPFHVNSEIGNPFRVVLDQDGDLTLIQDDEIKIREGNFIDSFEDTIIRGVKILKTSLSGMNSSEGDLDLIIRDIYKERIDSENIYVITGGHFSDLYIRNLGIFFNTILDKRTAASSKDWMNRQKIAIKTLALDMEALRQLDTELPTTLSPVGKNKFITANVHTKPSDSMFAIVYTLRALTDPDFISDIYPIGTNLDPDDSTFSDYTLQTIETGNFMISSYEENIRKGLKDYYKRVYDTDTGLVSKDFHLSSAKDAVKRKSSFYDNVILWATMKYAVELGILVDSYNFDEWRERIILNFWDEERGIFIDDLSDYAIKNGAFSGDSLIVLQTRFLDRTIPEDRSKLQRITKYIQKHGFDYPMPLRYGDNKAEVHLPVALFAPDYQTNDTIWSHWGMEYIKLLYLSERDEDKERARYFLEEYKKRMIKYGGYPELYDKEGNFFESGIFYKAVLKTGWVVNFEQAQKMIESG